MDNTAVLFTWYSGAEISFLFLFPFLCVSFSFDNARAFFSVSKLSHKWRVCACAHRRHVRRFELLNLRSRSAFFLLCLREVETRCRTYARSPPGAFTTAAEIINLTEKGIILCSAPSDFPTTKSKGPSCGAEYLKKQGERFVPLCKQVAADSLSAWKRQLSRSFLLFP